MLTIRMFGPFQVLRDSSPVTGMSLRAAQLLALLLLTPDRDLAKSAVADKIWLGLESASGCDFEEEDRQRRQASFRQALADLNRAIDGIPELTIEAGYGTIRLHAEDADVDLYQFDNHIAHGKRGSLQAYEEACLLSEDGVGRRLLEGWEEHWIAGEREWRSREYLRALAVLADHARQRGDCRKSAYYVERAVAEAPEQIASWNELMEDFLAANEPIAVLNVYKRFMSRYGKLLETGDAQPDRRMKETLRRATQMLQMLGKTAPPKEPLEPAGGALGTASRVYMERESDTLFHDALGRTDGLILVKGPRQVGKTSLLTRGRAHAELISARVAWTDLQAFDEASLATPDALYRALGRSLEEELDPQTPLDAAWNDSHPPNENLARYLKRNLLQESEAPLVWILDEVDRLFACSFKDDVFGWFRALYNRRQSCAAGSPLRRLIVVFAYATEARLLITDPNMSPFNVGSHVVMTDFTRAQVAELNERYRSPLAKPEEIDRFYALLGGHPFLVCRGLFEMSARQQSLAGIEKEAVNGGGIFGDHLHRLGSLVEGNPIVQAAVLDALIGKPCPSPDVFLRLQAGGLLIGDARSPRFRCELYRRFLESHLL